MRCLTKGGLTRVRGRSSARYLNEAVPADHVVRRIDGPLDLGWIRFSVAKSFNCAGYAHVGEIAKPAPNRDQALAPDNLPDWATRIDVHSRVFQAFGAPFGQVRACVRNQAIGIGGEANVNFRPNDTNGFRSWLIQVIKPA
jgi:hypothetical protein